MSVFNHVAIKVSSLERSKEFYSSALGLSVAFEHPISGPQFEEVSGIQGFDVTFAVMTDSVTGVNIELVEFHNDFEDTVPSFCHLAFGVDDVDELYGRLKEMGVTTISAPLTLEYPHEKIRGKRFFYFRDPDGYTIEAYNNRKGLYSD
jgi:catechol 2,3-dioxygenase-like lactoylglutathione lyase family enzyme